MSDGAATAGERDAVSKEFLRNYLDAYDYNHMILEKSDVDEFEAKYATTLDERIKDGDVEAAYEIFDRVTKRLDERVAFVKTLTSSTFTFTSGEKVVLDRHELGEPRPARDRVAGRHATKSGRFAAQSQSGPV